MLYDQSVTIAKMKNDRTILESMQAKVTQCQQQDSTQTSLCKQLSSSLSQALSPGNRGSLTNSTNTFNDTQKANHNLMATLISDQIRSLDAALSVTQNTQRAYLVQQEDQRAS